MEPDLVATEEVNLTIQHQETQPVCTEAQSTAANGTKASENSNQDDKETGMEESGVFILGIAKH